MIELFSADIFGRLDNVILHKLPNLTRSQIKLQIEKGRVLVNDKVVFKAGFLVKKNDIIKTDFLFDEPLDHVEPENLPLDIVYEDNDLAVINKPRGMTVHPAAGNFKHTLANAIAFYFKSLSDVNGNIRPGIVHRIDKDTTGLLVIAKNNIAHLSLAKQIQDHSARRTYWALVEGVVKQDSGTINTFIARDKNDRKKMAVVLNSGKKAISHFTVLRRFDSYSLLEFVLETGRTHQIRVHCAHIGHPIVGDLLYGYKKQKFKLDGQLLHAKKLTFIHPMTGKIMNFEVNLPNDFIEILRVLGMVI